MPNQATLPGGGQPGHTSRIHVDQQRVSLATSGFRQLAKCQTGQSGDTAQAVQSVDRVSPPLGRAVGLTRCPVELFRRLGSRLASFRQVVRRDPLLVDVRVRELVWPGPTPPGRIAWLCWDCPPTKWMRGRPPGVAGGGGPLGYICCDARGLPHSGDPSQPGGR